MGLFKKDFKSSNIKSINDITKIGIKDTIDGTPSYYALQRLATTFKQNKEMDLAIKYIGNVNSYLKQGVNEVSQFEVSKSKLINMLD